VLAGLYELLRGLQAADDHAHGSLLQDVLHNNPDLVYEGLLTVLLRLVFLLYAEDRDLMPPDEVYAVHYSVGGLFDRLRADAGRHPDTMDLRYGAWAQLLSLYRIIFDGVHCGSLHLPPRHGHLFDPDRFPFLEGRPLGVPHVMGHRIDAPLVSDGVVWRVLQNLLVLDGERLSYRSLDVEQIGSVYETMMGFRLELAGGHSLALKPAKPHGAPITINVDVLLATPTPKRTQWVREQAEQQLTGKEATALASAVTASEVEAAIERKVDRRATPNVVPAGAMVLQPNEERRRSGSFYTPRSLTEPIVSATLRPIFDRLGDNPTPDAILNLKICDPAMGSGAFLVETCRQLAEKLVDSWHAHECLPSIPPDSDELLHASRLVAHRCLYGVDINPIAVDLAKLSLWLTTLARDHAFTFLDHSLRGGDSLVGLTRDQIVTFHWLPSREKDFVTRSLLQTKLEEAERLRADIRDASDDVDFTVMHRLLQAADSALDDLRLAGDLVVLAFFSGTSERKRQEHRDRLAQQVWAWQQGGDAIRLQGLIKDMRVHRHIIPFHWEIEFPEVFDREPGGFDAMCGNPPFLGGTRLEPVFGRAWRDYLVVMVANGLTGTRGAGDLAAYFLLRCFRLLRPRGCLGFVTTNSIAQGDTRTIGLAPLVEAKATIYGADSSIEWPGQAGVEVARVWLSNGQQTGPFQLNGKAVARISSSLREESEQAPAQALLANADLAFEGAKQIGDGFILKPAEAHSLMKQQPDAARVVRPFLSGQDINSTPDSAPSRWAINFWDWPLDRNSAGASYAGPVALDFPACLQIVEERVRPFRMSKPPDSSGNRSMRDRWWQYFLWRPALHQAMKSLERVLVRSRVSNTHAFVFSPTDVILSDATVVFTFDEDAAFSCLQSRVHEEWARVHASTMRNDLRYTPTSCFQTFAFPSDWRNRRDLSTAGKVYYEFRSEVMLRHDEGLTKTYNRFNDPTDRSSDIQRLRELHDAMDRAVLDSYGWSDIPTACEFLLNYESEDDATSRRRKLWRYRWPDDIRDEVLVRLLALNGERAEAERLQLGDGTRRARPTRSPVASAQLLFEEG
jgi:hypothetical protein